MTHQSDDRRVTDWDRAWFRVEPAADCVVVTAAGEIDVESAVGLGEAVRESLQSSSRLVVDLSRVTFIDSTGLGALIDARRRAVAKGGSVSLVKPPDLVRRILAGTQLQHFLPVFESLRAALDALDTS